MLVLGIIILQLAIALTTRGAVQMRAICFNRLAVLILVYSSLLAFNTLYVEGIATGVASYAGVFHVTLLSQSFDCFLLACAAIILLLGAVSHPVWRPEIALSPTFPPGPLALIVASAMGGGLGKRSLRFYYDPIDRVAEYPLVILFTTLGMSSLISSSDLLSMFLSIELQTLALYILATIYRDSEAATSAALKYFLLGALSSSLILLGSSLLYGFTGVSSFEGLYLLCSMGVANRGIKVALLIIAIALLFKVAAAPFHNWAPDVYDGVPTIVTTWVAIMPKVAILAFLIEFQAFTHPPGGSIWGNILLVSALLSLLIGAVVGVAQYRIKRLLAYSTISHMGFLLLALAINSAEGIEGFIFYLVQYVLTSTNIFFVLVSFGNNPIFLRIFPHGAVDHATGRGVREVAGGNGSYADWLFPNAPLAERHWGKSQPSAQGEGAGLIPLPGTRPEAVPSPNQAQGPKGGVGAAKGPLGETMAPGHVSKGSKLYSPEYIFHIMHMHVVKSNPALGLCLAISLFSMAG
jgi:NADH-ubiquinone oxidoreductase chain 2